MRILELFAGYGSQAMALKRLGFNVVSDISEIDKYAIDAYNQLHGKTFNYGDICEIDETKLPKYDLITYSSPCQDFSVAGLQKGGEKGSGTRSSLLWECERIIRAVKPKYLLMENVKALTSKKFMPLFQKWLDTLDEIGYDNYWKVLNAKDYGVPQNRERVFVVSIRKDLNKAGYKFPEPRPLTIRLKDVLETSVDEKYYLSDKTLECFNNRNKIAEKRKTGFKFKPTTGNSYSCSITTRAGQRPTDNFIVEPKVLKVGNIVNTGNCDNLQRGRIYEPKGCSPALNIMQGGGLELKIVEMYNPYNKSQIKDNYVIVPEATKQGYAKAYCGDSINLEQPNSKTRRGRVGHQMANTLTCSCNIGVVEPMITEGYRIRKLTPRECWRLMGVKDEQFDKLSGISNSQLYKMAGNSIVVDVLVYIFANLFDYEDLC